MRLIFCPHDFSREKVTNVDMIEGAVFFANQTATLVNINKRGCYYIKFKVIAQLRLELSLYVKCSKYCNSIG